MVNEIQEKIRQFVLNNSLGQQAAPKLTYETKLRTSGLLDSLAILNLVIFVENEHGLELQPQELGIESFDSIADLAALIDRKRSDRS
jgi:acyl carrier protein